jgi:hypothetical protein
MGFASIMNEAQDQRDDLAATQAQQAMPWAGLG